MTRKAKKVKEAEKDVCAEKVPRFAFSSAATLLDEVLSLDYFHEIEGTTAIPFHRVDGSSPLVVITGDNASGKSFFRRLTQLVCRDVGVECIHVSVEGRRQVSYQPWLVFVYGDETHEATGVNSANTVTAGIKTCQEREKDHVVFWDEPDLGLSDGWAAGMGVEIRKFAEAAPPKTLAALVVTHNRALVRQLLPLNPTYLHLGAEGPEVPPTLQEWVDRPSFPLDINQLSGRSRERFKRIQHIINRAKP